MKNEELQSNLSAAHARFRDLENQRQKQIELLTSLQALNEHESDVRSAMAELDRQENQAMEAWAADGATGDAPTFDHPAREDLNRQLVEAQSKSRAAASAAAPVQASIMELNARMKVESDILTVCALAVLTAEAKGLGAAYRTALAEVERRRIYLQTLDRFLADRQDTNNQGTTAFIPMVVPHLELRDFFIEPIRDKAAKEANDHWQTLFQECLRAPA